MSWRALLAIPPVCLTTAPSGQEVTITGAVVEDHSGAALPGATIALVDSGGRTIATAETDRAGRFDFRGADARPYEIYAEKLHYVSVRPGCPPRESAVRNRFRLFA